MTESVVIAIAAIWIAIGLTTAWYMGRRGHSPYAWGVIGTVFGPMVTWFDPSVITQPVASQLAANNEPGMFGYMGRNVLTGPGRNNWDSALHKEFPLPWFRSEHSTLQFRLETFNTFNHPQWEYVNTGCSGSIGPS